MCVCVLLAQRVGTKRGPLTTPHGPNRTERKRSKTGLRHDLPVAKQAARERGEQWVGRSFVKNFPGYGRFRAHIVAHQREANLYTVQYDDGEVEELRGDQVERLLHSPSGYLASSKTHLLGAKKRLDKRIGLVKSLKRRAGHGQNAAKPVDEVCVQTQRILRQFKSLTNAAAHLKTAPRNMARIMIERREVDGSYFQYATATSKRALPRRPADCPSVCEATRSRSAGGGGSGSVMRDGNQRTDGVGKQRIAVRDALSGRVLVGRAAPKAKNLQQYLLDRPTMRVLDHRAKLLRKNRSPAREGGCREDAQDESEEKHSGDEQGGRGSGGEGGATTSRGSRSCPEGTKMVGSKRFVTETKLFEVCMCITGKMPARRQGLRSP